MADGGDAETLEVFCRQIGQQAQRRRHSREMPPRIVEDRALAASPRRPLPHPRWQWSSWQSIAHWGRKCPEIDVDWQRPGTNHNDRRVSGNMTHPN